METTKREAIIGQTSLDNPLEVWGPGSESSLRDPISFIVLDMENESVIDCRVESEETFMTNEKCSKLHDAIDTHNIRAYAAIFTLTLSLQPHILWISINIFRWIVQNHW